MGLRLSLLCSVCNLYDRILLFIIPWVFIINQTSNFIEAQRFTEEQKNVLDKIRTFLGKDATNNIIFVFSKANRVQTNNRNVMERDCVRTVSSFIQVIG